MLPNKDIYILTQSPHNEDFIFKMAQTEKELTQIALDYILDMPLESPDDITDKKVNWDTNEVIINTKDGIGYTFHMVKLEPVKFTKNCSKCVELPKSKTINFCWIFKEVIRDITKDNNCVYFYEKEDNT